MSSTSVIVPTFPNSSSLPREQTPLIDDEYAEVDVPLDESTEEDDNKEKKDTGLKKRIVWTYGIGETGVWSSQVIVGFYFTTFLLEIAHIDPYYAGNILLVGQIWDAIVNPIVGTLSDGTESRWGRRRPWLLFTMIPFGLTYFGLWFSWPDDNHTTKVIYYLMTLLFFNTFANTIAVPYAALTSDLAKTYDEATELTQARMLYNILSGVIISFVHSLLIKSFKYPERSNVINYAYGYWISGLFWGLLFVLPPFFVFLFIREKVFFFPEEEEAKTFSDRMKKILGAWKRVFGTLLNKSYLILTSFFFLSWTAVQLVQNNLLLYTKYVTKTESDFQWYVFLIQIVAAATLFFWSFISRKIGKNWTYLIGLTIWIGVEISLWWFNENTPTYVMFITSFIAGCGISVVFLIPWSMIPDIIDDDELKNGIRREGVFYSLFVLFQKMGLAIALSGSSYLLAGVGYRSSNGDDQPEKVKLALRLLISIVPTFMLLLSIIISWFYPLTKERIAYVHEKLREKRLAKIDESNREIDE